MVKDGATVDGHRITNMYRVYPLGNKNIHWKLQNNIAIGCLFMDKSVLKGILWPDDKTG